jgi:PAS domain S-box-containing protein
MADSRDEGLRFLRQVLDLDPNLIFVKDRAGRFVFVNEAVADAYCTTTSELIGRTDADFNPNADEVEHFRKNDLEVMETGLDRFIAEEQVSDRYGRTRWFQTVKRAIRSETGTVNHVLGVSVDITARKQAEETLRKRTQRLVEEQATLLDLAGLDHGSLPEAFDHIARIMTQLLGPARVSMWTFDEDIAVRRFIFDPACPEPRGETSFRLSDYPILLTALRDERSLSVDDLWTDPRTTEIAGGPARAIGLSSLLVMPVRLGGKLTGLLIYAPVDTPRQWTVEEKSISAAIADFVALALEADRRRDAERQLMQAQKMEAVGLLAGGLAHDFNNLLTAILSFVSLTKTKLPTEHPVIPLVERIEAACGRAAGMTRQLLAFSKHNFVEIELLDANGVVAEVARIISRVLSENTEVVLECSDDPLMLRVDRTQLDQILFNLATNASHAMPGGGRLQIGTQRVELTEGSIRHPRAHAGSYFRLIVADTGIGIAPADLERIWEPFFTTKKEGTGLGLATVYAIVQRYQGFVTVESEQGRGTRFEVYLPLAAAEAQPDVTLPDEPRGDGETILLVDDESMLRELVGEGLTLLGYRVLAAGDGQEAVEVFRRHRDEIALAVVDVVLPNMSGPAICRRLRLERPELPVLLMSGHAPDRLSDETAALPMIPKPFKVPALVRRIRQLIARPASEMPERAAELLSSS